MPRLTVTGVFGFCMALSLFCESNSFLLLNIITLEMQPGERGSK